MDTWKYGGLLCLFFATAASHLTACNQGNATLCLEGSARYQGVRMLLQNTQYFWFGDRYVTDCPADKGRASALCRNPAPDFRSIITRMRMAQDNETDSVAQTLDIHYDVTAGSYQACGGRHEVGVTNKTIDNVHTLHNDAWALNHRPRVRWQVAPGLRYTLAFWEAGHFLLQGLWVNIAGGSIEDGDEVISYRGPQNPFPRKTPYVFALFTQASDVSVTGALDDVKLLMQTDDYVDMSKLITLLSLTGPVGIGLVRTQVDAFSAQSGLVSHVINSCPYVISDELQDDAEFPLSMTGRELSVSVSVTFSPPDTSFLSCCHRHTVPKDTMAADPLVKAHIHPVYTRLPPRVKLVHTYIGDLPDNIYYSRRMFTLLLVCVMKGSVINDTTAPHGLLQWQVVNIHDADLRTGETTVDYQGAMEVPAAPDHKVNLFLLLEQPGVLTRQNVQGFTAATCRHRYMDGRCKFDLVKFMKDLNLVLVGISGFRSSEDEWSRMKSYASLGVSQGVACLGVEDYSDPCPSTPVCTGVASLPSLGHAAFAFTIVSLFFSI